MTSGSELVARRSTRYRSSLYRLFQWSQVRILLRFSKRYVFVARPYFSGANEFFCESFL